MLIVPKIKHKAVAQTHKSLPITPQEPVLIEKKPDQQKDSLYTIWGENLYLHQANEINIEIP
jgi:hypothetical protein